MPSNELGKMFQISDTYSDKDLALRGEITVPILIPTYNSEQSVPRVIDNLTTQKLPENIRLWLIVNANCCVDKTATTARIALDRFQEKHPKHRTKLIVSNISGEPQALNTMLDTVGSDAEFCIGVNDDVFPTQGALSYLISASLDHPELGAIGVPPRTLPTYRAERKDRQASKVAAAIASIIKAGESSIVGRFYSFRPSVIGRFPDLMSEDGYMTFRSIVNSSGYGIVLRPEISVYNRVPDCLKDLLKDHLVHSIATRQLKRAYPEFGSVYLQARGATGGKISRVVEGFKKQDEFDFLTKLMALGIMFGGKFLSWTKEEISPSNTSKRPRVASAVWTRSVVRS